MPYTDTGSLFIRTILASGALPLENTLVHIRGADEENRFVEFSLITDRDGNTERVTLPAPSRDLSLAPAPAEVPYGSYDVTVTAEGHYPKTIRGVAVFSGIEAMQPISMIPIVDGSPARPIGNLVANVEENPELE